MQILREPTLRNCRQQCAKKGTYTVFDHTWKSIRTTSATVANTYR